MVLDRKNVSHGAIPVGKVMSLETAFKTTSYNTVPPAPGMEWGVLPASTDGYVLTCSAAAAEGVAWTNVVTTSAPQTANLVMAGPASGSAAAPTFRALVTADMPSGIALSGGIAAWGASIPSAQPSTTGTTTGTTAGISTIALHADSVATGGGSYSTGYTLGDIVLALKQQGLLAP